MNHDIPWGVGGCVRVVHVSDGSMWAVTDDLVGTRELRPPHVPSLVRFTEDERLPMPSQAEEAEQRRKEWMIKGVS